MGNNARRMRRLWPRFVGGLVASFIVLALAIEAKQGQQVAYVMCFMAYFVGVIWGSIVGEI